ncbi:polyubiquitin-like [Telopea speciosissima]|uniref:polyubiquitin-like n=1 Tax=Telopea speciosissima TaxID=54955 RepID=UPI001CC7C4BF|nr:polyubiquitin-like [Telopea speciosissima]
MFQSKWLGFSIVSMANATGDTGSTSLNSNDEEMNIFLKVVKTVALKVKKSERIKDIKAKFQEREGITGKIQGLFFDGNELKDNQTLVDYAVQRNSTLHLFLQSAVGMKLFVRLPPNQRTIVLGVDKQDFVQNIKAMIQEQEGISQNCFTLIYSGRKLEDNWTLAANNIHNEATLQLVFNPRDMITISVKTSCVQTMRLEVKMLYTIHDVKSIVECMSGIPIYKQKFIYAGQQLVDGQTLVYYDITEESVIEMLPPSFQIFVKTWSGKIITLEVESSNTVKDVMAKINQKLGGSTSQQRLQFAGRRLEEDTSLGSYMIQKDSTLNLVISPSVRCCSQITIYVKASNGKPVTMLVDRLNTIHEVKAMIRHSMGLVPTMLIYKGLKLSDSSTLLAYGIQNNSKLTFHAMHS